MMEKVVSFLCFLLLAGSLEACNPNATTVAGPPAASRSATSTASPPTVTPTSKAPKGTEAINAPVSTDCRSASTCDDANSETGPIESYDHIIVHGLPFQRGESHGRQAKDKILRQISFYKSSSSMPAWEECIDFVKTHYVDAIQHYFPNGYEEMKGIARGANVSFEDIVVLNARYDISRWKRNQDILNRTSSGKRGTSSKEIPSCLEKYPIPGPATHPVTPSVEYVAKSSIASEECTGAVALSSSTKYAHVLLGQNWDINEFILKNDTAILLEVHPDPCERIKPFVTLTEAGQLGRSGMNADGMGIIAMGLWSSADVFTTSNSTVTSWVPVTLLRRMFLEAPTFSMGLRTILRTPRHVSNNMIIATAEDEALNIELTPNEYFITQVPLEKEILAHSNHFKSAAFLARNDIREGSRGGSSLFRDRRVERHLINAWPRISEITFQKAFKDHVGSPNAVCEHFVPNELSYTSAHPRETTVASIIYNLSQRTLQITKGPPCMAPYKNYRFNFSQF